MKFGFVVISSITTGNWKHSLILIISLEVMIIQLQ